MENKKTTARKAKASVKKVELTKEQIDKMEYLYEKQMEKERQDNLRWKEESLLMKSVIEQYTKHVEKAMEKTVEEDSNRMITTYSQKWNDIVDDVEDALDSQDERTQTSRVYKNWYGHKVNLLGALGKGRNTELNYDPFSDRKALSVRSKPKEIEYQREVNIIPEPEVKPLVDNSRFLKKHYEMMQIKNNQKKYRNWINRKDVLFARILRLILNYLKSIFDKIFKHNIEEFRVRR